MRIERIILRNYRQFKESKITFQRRLDTDLHYFIGKNGTGKTNLLNAINWCLYNEEPHLSKGSHGLPLINLKTIGQTEIGKERDVIVEVWAETEKGRHLTFKRRANYRKHDNNQMESLGIDFEVRYEDESGNTKIVSDEDASAWVERFVPNNIREFFFFDGERLDNYFKEATAQKIRHAVFQISQIDLLENRVERKLQEILGDLVKEAGKVSPKIEYARERLEKEENNLSEINKRIGDCRIQIETSKNRIADYDEKLKGVPDIASLEEERQRNKKNSTELKILLSSKEEGKKLLILDSGRLIMLWPAIKLAMQVISTKRSKKEIPPLIEKRLLEEVIRNNSCSICGNILDVNSSGRVKELLKDVELSSEIAQRLSHMEPPLYLFMDKVGDFDKKTRAITEEIESLKNILSKFTQRNHEIDSQLSGYNENMIRKWYEDRNQFEEIRDQNQRILGGLEEQKGKVEDTVCKLREELENELKKEKKVQGLIKKLAFCERALDVVKATREVIMKETREKIERETKKQFFKLIWKKETFGDVRMNDDYSIGLIHKLGYDCLGSISAGERELLALSFTLALHDVSGFDSPILIDTPVARISDANRENFAKVLCEVSTNKQVLLLFTPDEYSVDISRFMSGRATGKYKLDLSTDETNVIVKEL